MSTSYIPYRPPPPPPAGAGAEPLPTPTATTTSKLHRLSHRRSSSLTHGGGGGDDDLGRWTTGHAPAHPGQQPSYPTAAAAAIAAAASPSSKPARPPPPPVTSTSATATTTTSITGAISADHHDHSSSSSPPRIRSRRHHPSSSSSSPASRARAPAGGASPQHRDPPVLPPLLYMPTLSVDTTDAVPVTTGGSPSTAGTGSATTTSATASATTFHDQRSYFDAAGFNDSPPRPSQQQPHQQQHRRRPSSRQRSEGADSPSTSHHRHERRKSSSKKHVYTPGEEPPSTADRRGHTRNRSHSNKGSGGTTSSRRSSKGASQKAMLSQALEKANTAVLLDNAQNFGGAMEAYSEACALLAQVMQRSSTDEDRRKLEAIRNTYTSRIAELTVIAPQLQDIGKALPARPPSDEPYRLEREMSLTTSEDLTPDPSPNAKLQSPMVSPPKANMIPSSRVPQRRESLQSPTRIGPASARTAPISRFSQDRKESLADPSLTRSPPMDTKYMPTPLSPTRPMAASEGPSHQKQASLELPQRPGLHDRAPSNESMSWLDTIDESGGSSASSVHSRNSHVGVRRKHIRAASGETEAEFDAALDAAVEAAYDEGYEPADAGAPPRTALAPVDHQHAEEVVADVRRKVELAKEKVRESERELALQVERAAERRRYLESRLNAMLEDSDGHATDDNESEEEERMLEEMTRSYQMDGFEFGLHSKAPIPRESDSSGLSGQTLHSSIGSNPTTTGTNLSTVMEASNPARLRSMASTPLPPTPAAPPPPPPVAGISPEKQGVRSRRLSGQNAKLLKIETTSPPPNSQGVLLPSPLLNSELTDAYARPPAQVAPPPPTQARPPIPQSARLPTSSSFDAGESPNPLTQSLSHEPDFPASASPNRASGRTGVRKNYSSSSLKNMKHRNPSLSVSHAEDDLSPTTPGSVHSTVREGRLPAMPTLPTPIALAFKEKLDGAPGAGGMYFLNNSLASPDSPTSPNATNASAPIPLEPCPTEFLLRPFWLMRALYQTIAHPRGGYLSTKLFVPRDVWRVKGVKLKNIEDKISYCDFLTAALMKLAQVDTFDADAVLEEMQALEGVLETVQGALTKKLGNEVGVQGGNGMFKDAPVANHDSSDAAASAPAPSNSKSGSMTSKSSSFSWRRLRPKTSAVGLANGHGAGAGATAGAGAGTHGRGGDAKESLNLGTLPMTNAPRMRAARRDVGALRPEGPNALYMASLARLFDAAQVIDQIARQVDDPGLRHADKTQVGLELCTRHAAEFFAFYVCRFVLGDVALLLDKFIKRGSEWVLV